MMKSTYSTFKDAAGIWIEDRFIPILQLSINLISSIILLKIFGLKGVFIGTILSSLVLWFYSYPKFVYKKLLNRSIKSYIKECIIHLFIAIFIVSVSYFINTYSSNIFISILISIFVPNILMILIYKNTSEYKYYKDLLIKIIKK